MTDPLDNTLVHNETGLVSAVPRKSDTLICL